MLHLYIKPWHQQRKQTKFLVICLYHRHYNWYSNYNVYILKNNYFKIHILMYKKKYPYK